MSDLEDLERTLRNRLDAIGSVSRAVLLNVLKLPDHERARRIGGFYGDPRTRTFAQLLIDLEESPHSRAVVLGELRERELRWRDLNAARLDQKYYKSRYASTSGRDSGGGVGGTSAADLARG